MPTLAGFLVSGEKFFLLVNDLVYDLAIFIGIAGEI